MPLSPEEGGHAMARQSHALSPIPEDTQRVARAAFTRGNISRPVADSLGTRYHDAQGTLGRAVGVFVDEGAQGGEGPLSRFHGEAR